MPSPYRFSPIHDKAGLLAAIEHIHLESFRICRKTLGFMLPVAGNVGVFCHFDEEFTRLTEMRKELTDISVHWNLKYYRLHVPIVIPAANGIPETTYRYLYIRKPDAAHPQVGDLDFYMAPGRFAELKRSLGSGTLMEGVKILDRTDLDLVELSDPESDVVAFVGSYDLPSITATKREIDYP